MSASVSDILTTLKNLVTSVNNLTQTYLNVQGVSTLENISAATLIKTSAGRVCVLSITTAGTTVGAIYDSSQVASLTNKLYVIPNTVGIVAINLVTDYGILVVPGSGQIVAVSWS